MRRIIVTEEQYKELCEYIALENSLRMLEEGYSKESIWQKIRQAIIAGVSATVIMAAINNLGIDNNSKRELIDKAKVEMENVGENEGVVEDESDTLHQEKVEAVQEYMETALRNQGYKPEELKLSADDMVSACEEYGFDLPFLMAQGHLESCFGMGRRARETNSVFSVGCYDSGKNAATYSTQNASIIPYIKLIQRDYLRDGKSLADLLKPDGFVNMNGHRYASNPNYEKNVKSIRNRILSKYPVLG